MGHSEANDHQNIITKLNHALNREVSTAIRYLLQSTMIKGHQWESVRVMYEEEVADELGHAKYLANKIVMLGGTPELSPNLSPPPNDPREMLKRDIDEERVDVSFYEELAKEAEEAGLTELKLQMEEQAGDEARHAEKLSRLLS